MSGEHVGDHLPGGAAVVEKPDLLPQFGGINYLIGRSISHILTGSFYTSAPKRRGISTNGP